ncbi:MAG: lysylphosphatidylglycerol synthase transmembrane domain-containing protein [Candidatus Neomarinimicrobiota bacterium]
MNKIIKFSIGLLLSVVGLFYAFRQFNWAEFIELLRGVNYWFLFAAVAIQLATVWIRALRWKWLLAPIDNVSIKLLFDATMIGYFGNNVLPLRMGELLRAYVVSNNTKISTSKVIGTLIVDRMLDFLALIFFAIFFLFFSDLIDIPKSIMIFSIILILILFIIIIMVGSKNPNWENIKNRYKIFQSKFGSKIFDIVANIISGLSVLNKTPHKIGVYSFIALLWIMYYISFILILKGVNLELSIMNAGVLYVLLVVSISIPAAPGYIGTYHATCVAVLTNIYNISLNTSQTFAVLSHAVIFIPFVLIGAIFFLKNSLNFSKLKSLDKVEA